MSIEAIREAARNALRDENMHQWAGRIGHDDSLSTRLSVVRSAIAHAIDKACDRSTLTALCRLYLAEQGEFASTANLPP